MNIEKQIASIVSQQIEDNPTLKKIESVLAKISSKLEKSANDDRYSERLLRLSEVSEIVSYERTWIEGKVNSGEFPKPIKIGRDNRWRLTDIENWMSSICE